MFPKAPSKPLSGQLQIIIAPPGFSVASDVEPEIPAGSDDNLLNFSLPTGFTIDESLDSLLARQIKNTLQSLDEIERRYLNCGPCRKKAYNPTVLNNARAAVKQAERIFSGALNKSITILLNHDVSGEISIEITYKPKTVIFVFMEKNSGNFEIGTFDAAGFVDRVTYSEEAGSQKIAWLLE